MTTPTPQDDALEPCPFCGSKAHFEIDDQRWEWIECESCGMQGNRSASLMEDCKPKLAEAWNRRAPQSGWLPISEAPRDGTTIILRLGDRVTPGHWMNEVEVLGPEYHSNGTYLGQYPTGEVCEAYWFSFDGGFTEEEPPTHFQFLPPPPSTKGEPT